MNQARIARLLCEGLDFRWRGVFSAIAAVAIAAGLTLSIPGAAVAQAPGQPSDPNRVVATVGNHKITEGEVDEEIKPQLASMQNQLYQDRRDAINKLADDYIIDQAAKKAKITAAEFIDKQIAGKSAKVTDKEAKEFYDQHKDRIRQPYDKIKAPLIAALQRRSDQQARQQVIARLREDHHVKVLLEPPRLKIATAGYPSLGPKNAPVTVVEFADFQCPYCKRSEDTIQELRKEYGDKMRLVYINFPLTFHQYAFQAAEAASCAGEQGKFWEYHDELFKDQSKLSTKDLKADAAKLKLNTKQFDSCLDKGKYADAVREAMSQGSAAGVNGTPGFFINGRPLTGAQPATAFESIINEELAHNGQHQRNASAKKGTAG
ncbi:MAG TPA: thioredoxin domain-containing protein [Candidatus Binataceae bacterium]|nr:thioredoxin domain-containing protein [Candidatus Binataceae bacterium]